MNEKMDIYKTDKMEPYDITMEVTIRVEASSPEDALAVAIIKAGQLGLVINPSAKYTVKKIPTE